MATIDIPDDVLKQAGLTERDARIEVACRLYDAGKLTLFAARQVAGLSHRDEMEDELISRGIAVYRPTMEDLESDLRTLKKLFGDPR
jgi:predicted HTH domain antitoxin